MPAHRLLLSRICMGSLPAPSSPTTPDHRSWLRAFAFLSPFLEGKATGDGEMKAPFGQLARRNLKGGGCGPAQQRPPELDTRPELGTRRPGPRN